MPGFKVCLRLDDLMVSDSGIGLGLGSGPGSESEFGLDVSELIDWMVSDLIKRYFLDV